MKKLFLLAFLALSFNAFSQTYIPIAAKSKDNASVVLNYFKGENRPSADFKFSDGYSFSLNAVCEGDYCWCIRNSKFEDIGYMKLDFEQNGKIAKISIKKNTDSTPYLKYLNLLPGSYKKVER